MLINSYLDVFRLAGRYRQLKTGTRNLYFCHSIFCNMANFRNPTEFTVKYYSFAYSWERQMFWIIKQSWHICKLNRNKNYFSFKHLTLKLTGGNNVYMPCQIVLAVFDFFSFGTAYTPNVSGNHSESH